MDSHICVGQVSWIIIEVVIWFKRTNVSTWEHKLFGWWCGFCRYRCCTERNNILRNHRPSCRSTELKRKTFENKKWTETETTKVKWWCALLRQYTARTTWRLDKWIVVLLMDQMKKVQCIMHRQRSDHNSSVVSEVWCDSASPCSAVSWMISEEMERAEGFSTSFLKNPTVKHSQSPSVWIC